MSTPVDTLLKSYSEKLSSLSIIVTPNFFLRSFFLGLRPIAYLATLLFKTEFEFDEVLFAYLLRLIADFLLSCFA
jgi:hypothetical protein